MTHSFRPLQFTEFKKYPICTYPWYKERLKTKYLNRNAKPNSNFIDPKDWVFIKSKFLDKEANSEEIIKGGGSTGPTLINNTSLHSNNNNVTLPPIGTSESGFLSTQNVTKDDKIYSKQTAKKREQHNNIDEVELGLIQHPLALYPHLETSVQPEIYEEIVDIIDPEMNAVSDEGESEDSDENRIIPVVESRPNSMISARNLSKQQSESQNSALNTKEENCPPEQNQLTYRWVVKKEEKERKKKLRSDPKPEAISENEHIKQITREFCEWVSGLGGENNNIEEPTVTSLFASGYETKPALSVPIHVIELSNVPPELRGNVSLPNQTASNFDGSQKDDPLIYDTNSGKYQRMRYGSWYLPRSLWKLSPANEQLVDPKLHNDIKKEEQKAKFDKLNHELAVLESPTLFEEFISKKVRKPKFLEEVAEIKQRIELEKQKLIIE